MQKNFLPLPLVHSSEPELPRNANPISRNYHGEYVTVVIFNKSARLLYSGGNVIKIWDVDTNSNRSIAQMNGLKPNDHIRSMKLLPDGRTLIAGGKASNVFIWNIEYPRYPIKAVMSTGGLECFGLAVSPDSKICFGSFSSGAIVAWDLHNHMMIAKLQGHTDVATCIDISPDGTIWTGSLDKTVRSWDLRTGEQLVQHNFSSSISTLGFCPTEKWLAVGFNDSKVYVLHETMAFRYQLPFHNSYVTNLKFVNSGQWFVSTGLDRMLNFWKTPNTSMFQIRECSGITSCDISADDTYIATACEYDMVSVYHVMY